MENNENIFEALRSWRREASSKAGVPPYFILSNQTLTNIANFIPETMDELLSVNGIGKVKLETYGEDILNVINLNKTPGNQRIAIANDPPVIDPETGEVINLSSNRKQEPKQKRIPTHHISCYMFLSGMTISEIAEERGILERSIEDHLCTCIEEKKLNALTLISSEVIDRIETFHCVNPDITSLKEMFLANDGAIPYSSIRFAISHLKSTGGW